EMAAREQQRVADLTRAQAVTGKAIADVQQMLAEDSLPSAVAARSLRAKADRRIGRVQAAIDRAPGTHWPAEWHQVGDAMEALAKMAEKDPKLAAYLEDVPTTFRDVMARARELGFDPAYVPDFTSNDVQRMVY